MTLIAKNFIPYLATWGGSHVRHIETTTSANNWTSSMENLVSPTSIIQTFCLVPADSDNQGWTTTLSEYTLEVEVFSVGAAGFLHAHCYSKCVFQLCLDMFLQHVGTVCRDAWS